MWCSCMENSVARIQKGLLDSVFPFYWQKVYDAVVRVLQVICWSPNLLANLSPELSILHISSLSEAYNYLMQL